MTLIPYQPGQVLRKPGNWRNLRFYHKTDALFQLTFIFCERFLPKYGDRTRDQMIQAARSGKQNIIEGSEDGKTSTEMEIKLINVARSSVGELREDYRDHLNNYHLTLWKNGHPRFQPMQDYTRTHNAPEDYLSFAGKWSEEEFCNMCYTLCFQVDAMMNRYLMQLEHEFVTEGGLKERMHKVRTSYRADQNVKVGQLDAEISRLKAECEKWKNAYSELKKRALAVYRKQQEEIAELKGKLGIDQ